MSEPQVVEIRLIQHQETKTVGPVDAEQEYVSPGPSVDPKRDAEIEKLLEAEAAAAGLRFERDKQSSSSHPEIPHHGGFATVYTVIEHIKLAGPYFAYMGGAAAGVAVFVRNTLGSITEWQKLRNGRSVEISVGKNVVKVTDGQDLVEVLKNIQVSLASLSFSASDILEQMKRGAKLYRGFGDQVELRIADSVTVIIPVPVFNALIDEHKISESGEANGFYRLAGP
jgi:hypothetical protein